MNKVKEYEKLKGEPRRRYFRYMRDGGGMNELYNTEPFLSHRDGWRDAKIRSYLKKKFPMFEEFSD